MADAAHDLLYGDLIDEVVEAELVWVLELELVVVGKEAEECEGLEDEVRGVGFVDELNGLALGPLSVVKGREHTFTNEGNRSRWMRYVRSVVCQAPAVKANSTSTALCRKSTKRV